MTVLSGDARDESALERARPFPDAGNDATSGASNRGRALFSSSKRVLKLALENVVRLPTG